MKFSLKSTCSSARLGQLTSIPRLPNFQLETPHMFFDTKGGTIPHLTHEVLQLVTNQNAGLHIPISHVTNIQDILRLNNISVSKFIGMNEFLTYCSFVSPAERRKGGFNDKNSISVWSRFGRKIFSPQSYMELIEDLQPDLFLLLADGDTHCDSSEKRNKKSCNSTLKFFDDCMQYYKKSKKLKQSQIIAALEGGFNVNFREQCSKHISSEPVFGVAIDGLHDCSEDTAYIKYEDIKPVVEASLKYISNNKIRIIHGSWNPSVMLSLIGMGIDMFDSSYPYIITEKKSALIFPNNEDIIFQSIVSYKTVTNDKNESLSNNLKSLEKDINNSELCNSEAPPSKKKKLMTTSVYEMSMLDSKHTYDFTPILKDCACLTCKNHTKAYIHHLINVQELLGSTLLMIHNIHHYLQFLSTIRKSIQSNNFETLKEKFELWVTHGEKVFQQYCTPNSDRIRYS